MAWRVSLMLGAFMLAGSLNYLLAIAGEPRALWLFRDLLGVAP